MGDEQFVTESWPAEAAEVGRALMLPGGGYTVDHPLLFWAGQVLRAGGWRVHALRWRVDGVVDRRAFVEAGADTLADQAGPAARTLVVGKSLGTLACGWASRHGYPGVWLTPLLYDTAVADTLRSYPAAGLLVGGSADRSWLPEVAKSTGLDVLEIPGGDHALHVGTDWRASLAALEQAMAAVEAFAGRLTA